MTIKTAWRCVVYPLAVLALAGHWYAYGWHAGLASALCIVLVNESSMRGWT